MEIRDIPDDWKKASVTPIYTKVPKEHPGNYRAISLSSVPEKVMGRVVLETIASQMKQVIGKANTFTKGKSCQTDLVTFHNKVTLSVDIRRAVHVVYLAFS